MNIWFSLLSVALMTFVLFIGVACDDDDDDDNDDDITPDDDDDNDSSDDDTGDDDTGDDDTGDDDTGDDDTGDDDTGDDDTFYLEDFESYTPPNLGGTWTVDGFHSKVEVEELTDDDGNVLHIVDGDVLGEDALVTDEPGLEDEMAQEFSLAFEYMGFYGTLGVQSMQKDVGLERENIVFLPVDGTEISVFDPVSADMVYCGTVLTEYTWHVIELRIDPTLGLGSYSVLVDGAPTTCVSIPFIYSDNPLAAYRFVGYSDEGLGGEGRFDNVVMY